MPEAASKVVQITSKRDRSPRYPAIGPSEALKLAEMIWKRDKRNPVSLDIACQHLGYKAKNGASLPLLAALKRYGLLVSDGAEVRITDEAHTLFIAPADHPERAALVKKMAMRPALFTEVLRKFPDGLPSDANLRFQLQRDFEFANVKAADNFIKSLREAIALAGVAPGDEITDSGSGVIAEEPDVNAQMRAVKAPSASAEDTVARPAAPPNTQVRAWNLGGDVVISVSVPSKLSKGNIEKLKKYVHALEIEASISWDDSEPE